MPKERTSVHPSRARRCSRSSTSARHHGIDVYELPVIDLDATYEDQQSDVNGELDLLKVGRRQRPSTSGRSGGTCDFCTQAIGACGAGLLVLGATGFVAHVALRGFDSTDFFSTSSAVLADHVMDPLHPARTSPPPPQRLALYLNGTSAAPVNAPAANHLLHQAQPPLASPSPPPDPLSPSPSPPGNPPPLVSPSTQFTAPPLVPQLTAAGTAPGEPPASPPQKMASPPSLKPTLMAASTASSADDTPPAVDIDGLKGDSAGVSATRRPQLVLAGDGSHQVVPATSPVLPGDELPSGKVCLQELSVTNVRGRNEGAEWGTSDPVLWVYEGQGNLGTVQKTSSRTNDLDPQWPETICIRLGQLEDGKSKANKNSPDPEPAPPLPRTDLRTCFDVRDDFDPRSPDLPPLLHFGCALLTRSWDSALQSLPLSGAATLHWKYFITEPAPPPVPPAPPSPPTPPPQPPRAPDVALRLNERFRAGGPTAELHRAGVLIHQFDSMDDPDPNGAPWVPGSGRRDTGDRISAALVYASMVADPGSNNIPIYSFDLAGLVLSPTVNRLLCGYPYDVGSLTRKCYPPGVSNTCIPGCSWRGHTTWCDRNHNNYPCAHRPTDLDKVMMLRDAQAKSGQQPHHKQWHDGKFYDELIFESAAYMEHLPHSVEAMFFTHHCENDIYDGPKCEDYVRGAHRSFIEYFGLHEDAIPLLKFDLWDWDTPFSS